MTSDESENTKEISASEAKRRTRRGFLTAGLGALAGLGAWRWLLTSEQEGGTPLLIRRSFQFNEKISRSCFDKNRMAPMPDAPPPGSPARLNGDLGLLSNLEPASYQLRVDKFANGPILHLSLEDLAKLPQTETRAQFKCIEGWSMDISYRGVKFSDFLAAYPPTQDTLHPLPDYVGLETPDREYYVSMDMESMLHPQTILATHLNGVVLSLEHGAPLRLIIPVKYGIKSLKRIGRIFFSNERPPDYWAERGYDWYSGL